MATRIVAPSGANPETAPVEAVTKKRRNARGVAKLPKGLTPQQLMNVAGVPVDVVSVPVIRQPSRKAPEIDPYLRASTIRKEPASICGYDLPLIQHGAQPGQGLNGEAIDYLVKVIWINRRDIEVMMRAVEDEHPELRLMLEIMRAFMCDLDTLRDETKHRVLSALSSVTKNNPEDSYAIESLETAKQLLGYWGDARRLILR